MQNVRSWAPILGWEDLTIFSACHTIEDYSEFSTMYYLCEKLALLEENITATLIDEAAQNTRFMGKPGAGKTTFLYYLVKKAKHSNSEIAQNYVFYIFHANKADHRDNHRQLVRCEVIKAWSTYFKACGLIDQFRLIENGGNRDKKETINTLVGYYRSNKKRFKKKLVFIIDDVDTLDEQMAYNIANDVISELEVQSVPKWISIREQTYNNYSSKTKTFLTQFFPGIYKLPDVSLYSIIQHRINNTSNNTGKNPFSRHLCDKIISKLYSSNNRSALQALKSILENVLPKDIQQHTAEEFIQEYLSRMSFQVLVETHHIPNIHSQHLRGLAYPLPFDLMFCIKFTGKPHVLLPAINRISLLRSRKNASQPSDRFLKIHDSDFRHTVKKLVDENIISQDGKIYITTDIGTVLQEAITSDAYNKRCFEMIDTNSTEYTFETICKQNIDYKSVVETFITMTDPFEE